MSVIYKYYVPMDDAPHVVPGQVVHAEMDNRDGMWVWSHVHDREHLAQERYQIYGTGHSLPMRAHHVATCMDPPFVWHLMKIASPNLVLQHTSTEGEASD